MTAESKASQPGLPAGIKNFITNIFPSNKESTLNIEEGLSKVNDAIPQQTKEYLEKAKELILNPAYVRPPKEFLGIGEERPYSLPREKALAYARVEKNFRYFYLNYGLLATLAFCVCLVFGSGVIVHAIALALAWGVVIKATKNGSFEYKGFNVTQKEATTIMSIITIFILMYILKEAFWGAFTTSSILICGHAILRNSDSFVLEEGESLSVPAGIGEATSLLAK